MATHYFTVTQRLADDTEVLAYQYIYTSLEKAKAACLQTLNEELAELEEAPSTITWKDKEFVSYGTSTHYEYEITKVTVHEG